MAPSPTDARYDPFKDESLGAPRKRKVPVRIDWRGIAQRLAEGEKPRDIAASLGLAENRIWRHISRSVHFQAELQRAADRQQVLARLTFGTTGQAAAMAHLGAAESIGDEAALWLAERTGLAGNRPPAGEPEDALAAQLGAAAWRPLRRRKPLRAPEERQPSAVEIAEHAEWLAAAAEFEAERLRARAAQNDPDASTSVQSNPDASRSIQSDPDASTSGQSDLEPFRPAPRPPAPPPNKSFRPPQRTIVDLDSPDLARLKAEGQLPP